MGTKSEFSRSEWENPFCSELDRCPAGFSNLGYDLVNICAILFFQDYDANQETTVSYKFVKEYDNSYLNKSDHKNKNDYKFNYSNEYKNSAVVKKDPIVIGVKRMDKTVLRTDRMDPQVYRDGKLVTGGSNYENARYI